MDQRLNNSLSIDSPTSTGLDYSSLEPYQLSPFDNNNNNNNKKEFDGVLPLLLQPPIGGYVCDICSAIFSKASGLATHKNEMHPKRPVRSWKVWRALQSTCCFPSTRKEEVEKNEGGNTYYIEEERE